MTLRAAIRVLELGDGFRMESAVTVGIALQRWKELTVEATRANDAERLKELSQAHEAVKRARRSICGCGERKYPGREKCQTCTAAQNGVGRLMMERVKAVIEVGGNARERVFRGWVEWRMPIGP